MLERFTVDVLADEVTETLLEGEPDARLAHRFFRKGRRDGRRAHAHESVARLLRTAVAVCGSTIGEQLVEQEGALRSRIARLAEQVRDDSRVGAFVGAAQGAEQADGPVAEPPTELPAEPPTDEPADELAAALVARRRRRAEERRREIEAAAAVEAAAAQKRRLELIGLEAELAALPELHRQRFDSSRETAELFWARYCNGFVQGQSRRGSRSRDVKASVERLDCPEAPFVVDRREPSASPTPGVLEGAR